MKNNYPSINRSDAYSLLKGYQSGHINSEIVESKTNGKFTNHLEDIQTIFECFYQI